MRIRALKPGFFKNELLAELSPWHRLCFQGLWCCADREGRIQDRPRRLKAEIFPYDDIDLNMLLWDLNRAGFVIRYLVGAHPYIWIPTWAQHQHPRVDEGPSLFPAYSPGTERQGEPEVSPYPAVRTTDTLPSLSRDVAVTPPRMGQLEVGQVDNGTSGEAADAPLAPKVPPFRAQDLIDLWNATTKPPIPRCRELTDDRRRKIRARVAKRPSMTDWRRAFEAINAQAFYRGQNDRGWVADFDYAIRNDTVIAKILERVATPDATDPAKYEWHCDHTPHCPNRAACAVVALREQA